MASMEEERGSLAAVVLGDHVYAIGGGGANVQLNSVEMLDPTANTWMRCKSLQSPRLVFQDHMTVWSLKAPFLATILCSQRLAFLKT